VIKLNISGKKTKTRTKVKTFWDDLKLYSQIVFISHGEATNHDHGCVPQPLNAIGQ